MATNTVDLIVLQRPLQLQLPRAIGGPLQGPFECPGHHDSADPTSIWFVCSLDSQRGDTTQRLACHPVSPLSLHGNRARAWPVHVAHPGRPLWSSTRRLSNGSSGSSVREFDTDASHSVITSWRFTPLGHTSSHGSPRS